IVSIISFFSGHLPVFFQREKLVFPSHFIWGFCLAFSYPLIKNYIGKHSNVFNVLCLILILLISFTIIDYIDKLYNFYFEIIQIIFVNLIFFLFGLVIGQVRSSWWKKNLFALL